MKNPKTSVARVAKTPSAVIVRKDGRTFSAEMIPATAKPRRPATVIVNSDGSYSFNGKLAQQLQELAARQGRTPGEIVIEAIQECLASRTWFKRVEIDLPRDLAQWLDRHTKKVGKSASMVIEELLVQDREFQDGHKDFPAEANAVPGVN